MSDTITIHGDKTFFVAGLMQWCMSCTSTTFNDSVKDSSARLFALAGFLPDLTTGQLRDIATGHLSWSVDEEANTVTLTTIPDSNPTTTDTHGTDK